VISGSTYREWLVKASHEMLERMNFQQKSLSLESTTEAFAAGEIPENLRNGLLLANAHYGDIDLEGYRLNIMQALDIAEGKATSTIPSPQVGKETQTTLDENSDTADSAEGDSVDIKQAVLDLISRLDKGEGVDFDTILSNAAARGHDRDSAEVALEELSEEGTVHEPRFGWFKHTT